MTRAKAYIILLAPFLYLIAVAELWFFKHWDMCIGLYGVGYIGYIMSLLYLLMNCEQWMKSGMFKSTVSHTFYFLLFNNMPDELGRLIFCDILHFKTLLNPETRGIAKLGVFIVVLVMWLRSNFNELLLSVNKQTK